MSKFLYFDGDGHNAMTFPVDRLLSVDQSSDTNVRLTFEHNLGTTSSYVKVDLTVDPGTEKAVMKDISEAIAFGKDQFIVVADSVTSNYINSSITAVSVDNSGANSNGLTAGAGITGGTGTVYNSWVEKNGNVIKTSIYIDLTGLGTSVTANDIVGAGTDPAYLGQVTTAQNGTIFAGVVRCLEVPTTNATDLDLYSATEGTGVFNGLVTSLTETVLLNSGGYTADKMLMLTALPAADEYLYISSPTTAAVATIAAGIFLIELYGTE
jgi:hypothetical protein